MLDRKYRIKTKGEDTVIEELKQRLQAKATKLKRYENRIQQFKINRSFQQDQKKVYQELSGFKRTEGVTPDAAESERFWSTIWGNEAQHNRDAQWLKDLREECDKVNQQDIAITLEMVTERVKKIPNRKASGPDGGTGLLVKELTSLHDRIAEQMNELVNNRAPLPVWMTTGRTVLCQTDPKKGNLGENYRPIPCLPLLWKLMTGIIADYVYQMLLESDILQVEQKGCRKESIGTKDQLLIDNMILNDSKR